MSLVFWCSRACAGTLAGMRKLSSPCEICRREELIFLGSAAPLTGVYPAAGCRARTVGEATWHPSPSRRPDATGGPGIKKGASTGPAHGALPHRRSALASSARGIAYFSSAIGKTVLGAGGCVRRGPRESPRKDPGPTHTDACRVPHKCRQYDITRALSSLSHVFRHFSIATLSSRSSAQAMRRLTY